MASTFGTGCCQRSSRARDRCVYATNGGLYAAGSSVPASVCSELKRMEGGNFLYTSSSCSTIGSYLGAGLPSPSQRSCRRPGKDGPIHDMAGCQTDPRFCQWRRSLGEKELKVLVAGALDASDWLPEQSVISDASTECRLAGSPWRWCRRNF